MEIVRITVITLVNGWLAWNIAQPLINGLRTRTIYYTWRRRYDRKTAPMKYWALAALYATIIGLLAWTWLGAATETWMKLNHK